MNIRGQIVSLTAVAIMALATIGCSSTQSTSMGGPPAPDTSSLTPDQTKRCQVFRSYSRDREIGAVMEACRQQMDEAACRTCLQMQ
jgi:hypothetical protein